MVACALLAGLPGASRNQDGIHPGHVLGGTEKRAIWGGGRSPLGRERRPEGPRRLDLRTLNYRHTKKLVRIHFVFCR